MAEIIRRIEDKDFKEVSALYNNRKSVEELKWLFTDPENTDIYNAFVAIKDQNIVIGAIGFSSSIYTQGKIELVGTIFMSWIVASDYKGFAGISLLKKTSELGDFAIAIAGSKKGQSFYPMLKYKYISNSDIYYKILNIKDYYNTIKNKKLSKKLGLIGLLLPSFFLSSSKKNIYKDVNLIPYKNNFIEAKENDFVFKKKITKNYINWLLDCPNLKTYAFNIKKGNNHLGVCVLYIQRNNNINKGRIIHLPFLGEDKKLWVSVIEKCLLFFKEEGCSLVTGLAYHEMSYVGFKNTGFIIKKHDKPIYIKDLNNLLSPINLNNWHIQYSEGDKGYRGI